MVYSLLMNNIKAGNEITNLQLIFHKFSQFIDEGDRPHIVKYISTAMEMAGKHLFHEDNAEELEHMEWSEVGNFRYGWLSIRGFAGEVLAAGLWNRDTWGMDSRTYFKLGDASQETEVSGGDLLACNDSWKRGYPVQVKTVDSLNHVIIHSDWLGYNENDVQRFAIVDPVRQQMIYTSYIELLRTASEYPSNPKFDLRMLLNIGRNEKADEPLKKAARFLD